MRVVRTILNFRNFSYCAHSRTSQTAFIFRKQLDCLHDLTRFSCSLYTVVSTKSTVTCRTMCTTNRSSKEVPPESEPRHVESDNGVNIVQPSLSDDYLVTKNNHHNFQDVYDERWDPAESTPQKTYVQETKVPEWVLRRGVNGVFEIGELVDLLREENALDLCTIKIPVEMDYADYMVLVTARNPRHMRALATFVRKRFKMKNRKKTDMIPRIEGTEHSKDWLALDLGNIVLHILDEDMRERLNLEVLWSVGPQFDDISNEQKSHIVQLLDSMK